MFILSVCLLSLVSASPLSKNSSQNDNKEFYENVTVSPFQKIIRTNDITIRDAIYSSPAIVLVGTSDSLLRCLYEDPTECEVFYKSDSRVHSLAIVEDFVFAGLKSGTVLKCNLSEKESCKNFETRLPSGTVIESLASADGNLYAGLNNGTILRCDLKETNSCQPFQRLGSSVFSVIQFNGFIYAGLWNGLLMRCSVRSENNCKTMYNMTSGIMGISIVRNSIFAVTWDGNLWNCTQNTDTSYFCASELLHYKYPRDIAYFNGIIYTLENDKGIFNCKLENNTDCSNYGNIKNSFSMALAYGTYQLQNRFRNEEKVCSWQRESKCPPLVTYYDAQQRAILEVNVKHGRLYNSLGNLVDTTKGDEGSSGPSAIFVMTPDGRLLMSNSHEKELLHTSSLFAGKSVAGAGEMVVKKGVIERMIACSYHYRSDVNLNRQVIQSLRSQGYEGSIDSRICEDVDNDEGYTNSLQ